MCGSLVQLNTKTTSRSSSEETKTMGMYCPTGVVGSECKFSVLLEFAADNDVEGFQRSTSDVSLVGEIGLWYGRQKYSKHMLVEHRTPLMIAAKYGSVDVVKLILSLSEIDVNLSCGADRSTALHCAASGGSIRSAEVVKLLLLAGADPCIADANGHRPFDVIVAPWNMPQIRAALEVLLNDDGLVSLEDFLDSTRSFSSGSSSLSSLVYDAKISLVTCQPTDHHNIVPSAPERKEYPVDQSIPDIKSSVYCTDEFRMFSFKVQPCSRAYTHDWTECPFVHPGENARRRDPRKFYYSSVPCPGFRNGTCNHGDLCEYAHGVFESWLHPAQYRTRICKDATTCNRRVCFFAHRPQELRNVSFGMGIQSPQSGASAVTKMDNAAAMNLLPGSPSALSAMSILSPFSPAMSPSANVVSQAPVGWPQHVPPLHLPGTNLQVSRLRSSLNASEMPAMELNMSQDFEMHQQQQQHPNNLSYLSQPPSVTNKSFSMEVSSPRYPDEVAVPSLSSAHNYALLNQRQQQRVLSTIKTNIFSPKNDRNSPWNMEPSTTNLEEQQQQSFRSLSSQELGYKLSTNNLESKWETPNSKVDWPSQVDELGLFCKSCSTESAVSWAQSLEKDSLSAAQTTVAASNKTVSVEGSISNSVSHLSDHAIFLAWSEQLHLDEIMA